MGVFYILFKVYFNGENRNVTFKKDPRVWLTTMTLGIDEETSKTSILKSIGHLKRDIKEGKEEQIDITKYIEIVVQFSKMDKENVPLLNANTKQTLDVAAGIIDEIRNDLDENEKLPVLHINKLGFEYHMVTLPGQHQNIPRVVKTPQEAREVLSYFVTSIAHVINALQSLWPGYNNNLINNIYMKTGERTGVIYEGKFPFVETPPMKSYCIIS